MHKLGLTRPTSSSFRDMCWAVGVLAVSAGLQLSNATRFSFWHDESFSVVLATRNVVDIITTTAGDVHPPLYYLLLHGWMSVVGQSDLAIRGLSILFLLLSLLVLFLILRRWIHPVPARWGMAIAAVGPFLLRYGIEARMYTLGALLVIGSTWFLLGYLADRHRKQAVGYGLCLAAALYTHYFVFPIIIVHGLFVYRWHTGSFVPAWERIRACLTSQRWWLLALGGAILLFLPWVPIAVHQTVTVSGGFWISEESILDPFHTLIFFQSNIGASLLTWWQQVLFGVTFLFMGGMVYAAHRANPQYRPYIWLLLGGAIMPGLVILVASTAFSSSAIYVDRYFVFFALFWYGLLGVTLWLSSNRPIYQVALAGIILAELALGIYMFYNPGNYAWDRNPAHDMKATMEVLNSRHQPGEKIHVESGGLYMFFDATHYNETEATVRVADPGYDQGNASIITGREDRLLRQLSDYQTGETVWLIVPREDQPDVPGYWQPASQEFTFNKAMLQKFQVRARD